MGYYADNLCGERLKACYAIAPPRVKQYLAAEIRFVLSRILPGDEVLELGCGYGRVTLELAGSAARTVGIDTSEESLELARELARGLPVARSGRGPVCEFLLMDAADLRMPADSFDLVVCVQNGISAFGVDPGLLLDQALRVTRPGGRILLSSYAEEFWPHRLDWFEEQARTGLLGEIDYRRTGDGVIACGGGFRAGTLDEKAFSELCARRSLNPELVEVDRSSLFCCLTVKESGS